jgi:hypothetical protein
MGFNRCFFGSMVKLYIPNINSYNWLYERNYRAEKMVLLEIQSHLIVASLATWTKKDAKKPYQTWSYL